MTVDTEFKARSNSSLALSKSISVHRVGTLEQQHQHRMKHDQKCLISGRATAIPKATANSGSKPTATISSSKSTVVSDRQSLSARARAASTIKPVVYVRECQKKSCVGSHRKENCAASSSLNETQKFTVGQKVIVPSLQHKLQGTVRFCGELAFKKSASLWVGIELDEVGMGKNDGSIEGVRYFTCTPKTGLFVAAARVVPAEENKNSRPTKAKATKSTTASKVIPSPSTEGSLRRMRATHTAGMSATCISSSKSTKSSIKSSKSTRIHSVKENKANTKMLPTRSTPLVRTADRLSLQFKREANDAAKQTRSSKTKISVTSSNDKCSNNRHSSRLRPKSANLEMLNRLLERSNQEKQALAEQMNSQEAAWDHLVNVKESYAIRLKEKEEQIVCLQQRLEAADNALKEAASITAEKNNILSRVNALESAERQRLRIIQQLTDRTRTLQQQLDLQTVNHEAALKSSKVQITQLREHVIEREVSIADLERECAELRQTHIETVQSFEHNTSQRRQQYEEAIQAKNQEMCRLQKLVEELQQERNVLPPTPTSSDMVDDALSLSSPQIRLEAQLNLATHELDREHDINTSLKLHVEELKAEIKRLNTLVFSTNSQYYNLRSRFEQEVQDKQRIMDGANIATQAQCRLEEETTTLRLTLRKTQEDLNEVLKKLAFIERQQRQPPSKLITKNTNTQHEGNDISLSSSEYCSFRKTSNPLSEIDVKPEETHIELIVKEGKQVDESAIRERRPQRDFQGSTDDRQSEVTKLLKEMANLESLLENKILKEAQLEKAVIVEKKKVLALEKQLYLKAA